MEETRNFVDACFDRIVGRRLAKSSHCFLWCFVGHHGHGVIFNALNTVRAHDGTHRLAQLQGGPAGVGANVVDSTHLHGFDFAIFLETQGDIKHTIGALHVATAHVFQTVFDQPDRTS